RSRATDAVAPISRVFMARYLPVPLVYCGPLGAILERFHELVESDCKGSPGLAAGNPWRSLAGVGEAVLGLEGGFEGQRRVRGLGQAAGGEGQIRGRHGGEILADLGP